MPRLLGVALLLGTWSAACTSAAGGAADDDSPDASGVVARADAAPAADGSAPDPDANRSDCPDGLPANLGKVEPLLTDQNQTDEYYFLFASVSDEPDPVQQFALKLYKGRGLFAEGVTAGTYNITGADTRYPDCDACIFMYAEKDELPYAFFMAESGTIQLETVGAELTGRVENVVLRMIDLVYDGPSCTGNGDPVCGNASCVSNKCGRQVLDGDCTTTVGQLDF